MKLQKEIVIRAGADAVWVVVADVTLQSLWNPRVASVDGVRLGPVERGDAFRMTHELSGRRTDSEVSVTKAEAPKSLELRMRRVGDPPERVVFERYRLRSGRAGTTLRQEIDLGRSGIPLWAQLVMWLIHVFGKPEGKPFLEDLRDLVEMDEAPTAPPAE